MINFKTKAEYREWAKNLRQTLNLDLKALGKNIENQILNLDVYKASKNVMSYMAKEKEIFLTGLFSDKSKDWFLPVAGTSCETPVTDVISLQVASYVPGKTKLIKNKFNILEPDSEMTYDQLKKKINLDLIFVPGLCFDERGYRIGFGKGYYDSFLKLNPDSYKIGVCPKEFFVEKLPTDVWDVKVNLVVQQ